MERAEADPHSHDEVPGQGDKLADAVDRVNPAPDQSYGAAGSKCQWPLDECNNPPSGRGEIPGHDQASLCSEHLEEARQRTLENTWPA